MVIEFISLKELLGKPNSSDQFKKIKKYKKMGYNMNIMQQSACLVVNPIMFFCALRTTEPRAKIRYE